MQSASLVKTKKQRSCAYPLYPLSEAAQFAQKIFNALGQGPFSRLSLAKGLGYSSFSGAVSGKIGALVQFGLLERARATYGFTALALEILAYPDESSLPAIARSAVRPVVFGKIFQRFEGKSLPLDLASLLEIEFGITAKAAPRAVLNFVSTMEFAGLMRENTLLPSPNIQEKPAKTSNIVPVARAVKDGRAGEVRVELPSGIIIIFPPELAYRLSLGEFASEIKNIDQKTGGALLKNSADFHLPPGSRL